MIKELKKFSIETLSDAMDTLKIKGVIKDFKTISKSSKAVGRAFTVKFCRDNDTSKCIAANYIDEVNSDNIIVIDNDDISECTVWGNILTQTAIKRKVKGTIINGASRDYSFNKRTKYPLFSRSINCKTGKGVVKLEYIQKDIYIQGIKISPNDYIFVENGIILVIPSEKIEMIIRIAREIEYCEKMIVKEIKKGESLKEAREKYNYNKFK